jgi:LysM repeat protein
MMPLRKLVLPAFLVTLMPFGVEGQSLRGSRPSVELMAREAKAHDLKHFESGNAVKAAVRDGKLVRLSGNRHYAVADAAYPYALPSARTFVERLASQHHAACGEKLVVTSATRPLSLRLVNSSDLSVHPAGMAIDLRKSSSPRCLAWLRQALLHLEGLKVIEATEEYRPPHFHVAIFPRQYTAYVEGRGGAQYASAATEATRVATSALRSGSAAPQGGSHVVAKGETLSHIARTHDVSIAAIRQANGMRNDRIVAGSVLKIPAALGATTASSSASTYQVRNGDSLWSIAKRHGISVDRLRAANNIRGDVVRVGQRLVIPSRAS